jgi:hypothetical protein
MDGSLALATAGPSVAIAAMASRHLATEKANSVVYPVDAAGVPSRPVFSLFFVLLAKLAGGRCPRGGCNKLVRIIAKE